MRTIDLFAGCGGLSRGLADAGFDVVAAFDNWPAACDVYAANFNHPIFNLDLSAVTDVAPLRRWQPEVIVGGPPCQDFSSAGKRDDTQGRADLTLTFARLVAEVQPTWVVMENVERILQSRLLGQARAVLQAAGYGLSQTVLDASRCGVPQSRKRFFLVGKLGAADGFLDEYLTQGQTGQPLTVHDYLGDALGLEHYYRHPRSYARRGVFSIHEPSPTVRGVNRPIPGNYVPHPGDTASVATTALRPLTTLERSYLQTFPPGYQWPGTKTTLEQLIGNAVPVQLAAYVGNCLNAYRRDEAAGQPAPSLPASCLASAGGQLALF